MNIKHIENRLNDLNEEWKNEMAEMQEALDDSQRFIDKMLLDLETLIATWKGQDNDQRR